MNPNFWFHITLLLLGLFALDRCLNALETPPRASLLKNLAAAYLIAILGFWGYSNMGKGHGENYVGTYHFSELWHYLLGSKYSKELGNQRIYDATATAFKETGIPPSGNEVRDLRSPFQMITQAKAIQRFEEDGKARFSPQRWEAFKADVTALHSASKGKYWPLHDMGYNPPPTYSLMVGAVSSLLPITPWSLNLMASFDWLLLLLATIILWRTFGPLPGLAFLIAFANNPLSNWFWIGGAYFRNIELLSITGAVCALHTKRWWLAGSAFSIAIAARGFPIAFAAGAFVPLGYLALKNPSKSTWEPIIKTGAALALCLTVLIGLATLQNGAASWKDFQEKISLHSKIFFAYHIGYEKLATHTGGEGPQYFDATDKSGKMTNFEAWNILNNERFNEHWLLFGLLRIGFWCLCLLACLKEPPRTAALLLGEATLFLFTLPANYYYILLALFCANACAEALQGNHGSRLRLWIAFSILLGCNLASGGITDPIEVNNIHNWALALGLGAYTLSLLFSQFQSTTNPSPEGKRAGGIILACAFGALCLLTLHPRVLPSTNPELPKTQILTYKNILVSHGSAFPQTLKNNTNWVEKTQWLANAKDSGTIQMEASPTIEKAGIYRVAISYTSAPDYIPFTSLQIGEKSYQIVTNSKSVEFPQWEITLPLEKGPLPIKISAKPSDKNTLLGIHSIKIIPTQ